MVLCSACNKSFTSETSLDQYIKDLPVHIAMLPCNICSIWLPDINALEAHIQSSPAHNAPKRNISSEFKCDICDTNFVDQQFLKEHLLCSPFNATSLAHKFYSITYLAREALEERLQILQSSAPTSEFDPCNRSLVSQDALNSHIQFASASTPTFECDSCSRSFTSQDTLDSRIRRSSTSTELFDCGPGGRSFIDQAALKAHIQSSNAHTREPHDARPPEHISRSTPIDKFFAQYPSFGYDPSLSPSVSYTELVRFYSWDRNDRQALVARRKYQSALEDEVRLWFGVESDLASWHSLCRAVGIEPLPQSCTAARKAVRGVYVNIVDLIQWARSGLDDRPIRRFKNLDQLSRYTERTEKFFPRRDTKVNEKNVVLRHLLRHILSSSGLGQLD